MRIIETGVYLAMFTLAACASAPASREPASSPVVKELRALYPYLSDADFKVKLEGAKDAFLFLRTFVPFFYQKIGAAHEQLGDEGVLRETGWCVGDAHPENFGTMLDDDGKAVFTINDPDDAGPCPLYADLLRLTAALRVIDAGFDLGPALEAYGSTLSGGKPKFSSLVEKLIKDADGEDEPSHSVLDGDSSLKRDELSVDLSKDERKAVESVVRAKFGHDAEIRDAFRTKKATGGSGGLIRYRVLFRRTDQHHPKRHQQVYEFKALQRPGMFPVASAALPADEVRYRKSLQLEVGAGTGDSYGVVSVLGKPMFLRPRWKGNKGIALADFSHSELKTLARDQAAALGALHRRAADRPAKYTEAFAKFSKARWVAAAERMAAVIRAAFEEAR